jgi:hypothetical protein
MGQTSTVEISAKWDESEFDNKIRLKKYRHENIQEKLTCCKNY